VSTQVLRNNPKDPTRKKTESRVITGRFHYTQRTQPRARKGNRKRQKRPNLKGELNPTIRRRNFGNARS